MIVRIERPVLAGPRSGVVAAHPLAVSAGTDVLAAGGNAVDAALTAAVVLAVVLPEACGLGGDALLLVHPPGEDPVAYLGAAATPRRPILPITPHGPASAGVPGAVAGLCAMHERFGRLSLEQLLEPAIVLAEHGFPVSDGLAAAIVRHRDRVRETAPAWPVLDAVAGTELRQPELAQTLRAIAADGPQAFYGGPVAEAIADATRSPAGDGIHPSDLADYAVVAQEPVTGAYGRVTVTVAPPPSQASLALIALEALDGAPPPGTADGEHAAVEAIKEAFARRRALAPGADDGELRATPLPAAGPRASALPGGTGTDHTAAVCTADAGGLVVSMLVSVFHEFGSGVLVPEAGFVLNNRLCGLLAAGDDPLAAPPPGWRPGHTLSPMLVELDGRRIAISTPGADGQVQTLVQVVRLLERGAGLSAAVTAPRWRTVEGRLAIEESFDPGVRDALAARGHVVDRRPDGHALFGAATVASAEATGTSVTCAADPRREAWAAVR